MIGQKLTVDPIELTTFKKVDPHPSSSSGIQAQPDVSQFLPGTSQRRSFNTLNRNLNERDMQIQIEPDHQARVNSIINCSNQDLI